MENVFTNKLNKLNTITIQTIEIKAKEILEKREANSFVRFDDCIQIDNCVFCDTYIVGLSINNNGEVILIDNDDEMYKIDDYRISIWVLAAITDELFNKKYTIEVEV